MKRDLVRLPKLDSSFLSCEKDIETILRKLFIESQPYSDQLKKLLVVNTKDCLDNEKYSEYIKQFSLQKLREDRYLLFEPRIEFNEHSKVRSFIMITFDSFIPNAFNPEFRDCIVGFDIICNTKYWDLGNYRLRPFKIAGIIDGLLNNTKLSGIGTLQFSRCNEFVRDENLSGYSLAYRAIHMTDDRLSIEDD